jgi:SAM-dependent methyltransferase
MSRADSNAPEHRRWNDPAWTSVWLHRQQVTEAVADHLVAHLDPRPAERVLDVGCGSGGLSLRVAELVGPSGAVLGVDISELLVELARERAADAGCENATFALADAQVGTLGTEPFDAVASQFGVMFFDEPTTAFANIRENVARGARLCFASWLSESENPWFLGLVLREFVDPPTRPGPGKHATGPFAFGDLDEVAEILTAAGWVEVDCAPVRSRTVVSRDAIGDDSQLRFVGVSDEQFDRARTLVDEYLSQFLVDDTHYEVPTSYSIVTARAPD